MSDAQADPTVAATLSAAFPEVDASIVSLILVEACGDAAEAARQLAVLAGEGGDDNSASTAAWFAREQAEEEAQLRAALSRSTLATQNVGAASPPWLPMPTPSTSSAAVPLWPRPAVPAQPSAPPAPASQQQSARAASLPQSRGAHRGGGGGGGAPGQSGARQHARPPSRAPKAPHNLTGGPSQCWFAAWHADGRVVPVARTDAAACGCSPANLVDEPAAPPMPIPMPLPVPLPLATPIPLPVTTALPQNAQSMNPAEQAADHRQALDLGWDDDSAATWATAPEQDGGADTGTDSEALRGDGDGNIDESDAQFLRDLFPTLQLDLDLASLLRALGREGALDFCFEAMAGCDAAQAALLPERVDVSPSDGGREHQLFVLCAQFADVGRDACAAALDAADGDLEEAAKSLLSAISPRGPTSDAIASDAGLAHLIAEFGDAFDPSVLRRALQEAQGDAIAAASTLSIANAARNAHPTQSKPRAGGTAFSAALAAASMAHDGTRNSVPPPPQRQPSAEDMYSRVRAQQHSYSAIAQRERESARAAAARNDREAAKRHERAAREAAHAAREAGLAAADATLTATNASRVSFYQVDLHQLHVKEALKEVHKMLGIWCTHFHNPAHLRFITGRGVHSAGGVARIQPAVCEMLQTWGVPFAITPDGGAVDVTVDEALRTAWRASEQGAGAAQ